MAESPYRLPTSVVPERYELDVAPYDPDELLPAGGEYQFRVDGERHAWRPETITHLQRAVRDDAYESYRRCWRSAPRGG